MLRLVKWAVVLAALGAVVALVPVGGRTLLARWQATRSPSQFVAGAWGEIEKAVGKLAGGLAVPRAASRGQGASARPPAAAPARPPPVERHTEADRSAVDAIVAEHAR